ncbi:MAG: sigma-54-dependent Fis family transcriptional regulator [Acidobacteria bacterium]|nr:MAG: sigma-54-dependent Fis family transcriptional regulator [Acidobacteriota bacterium]
MMAGSNATSTPDALAPALGRIAGRLRLPPGTRWGVSVDGASFVGPRGPIEVPEAVGRRAAAALACGTVERAGVGGRCWFAGGTDRPFPARVVLEPAGPLGGETARAAVDALAAALSEEVLPSLAGADPWIPVVAASPGLRRQLTGLARAARSPLPVLILGETGTGKEVVARALHEASGRHGPFVAESCAALPETLLEAELFGSRRGAYTGAVRDRPGRVLQASGGTLLLDEVGELPPALQAKLLRLIQERELRPLGGDRTVRVDVRFVAATHRDLPRLAAEGAFRADLYYRLAGLVVRLPPLAARREDLPYLAAALLARAAADGLGPGRHLSPAALSALSRLPLRGNVRELDNILRRAAVFARGPRIDEEALVLAEEPPEPPAVNLERAMIEQALERSAGVKAGAARRLGWTRQKLYRRMRALGLR